MLFSNHKIANYINVHFEPTWKSLRPVPKVTIDFGRGTVLKRTLNGNIATFLCTADGTVVDVIAGINDPERFLQSLQIAESEVRNLPEAPEQRLVELTRFHETQTFRKDIGGLLPLQTGDFLSGDTRLNAERRHAIHAKLRIMADAKPDDITHWLYREILHADLDDPMLGLQKELFGTYPFNDAMSSVQFADEHP